MRDDPPILKFDSNSGHIPAAKSEADVKLIQEKEERIALVEMKFRKLVRSDLNCQEG